MIEFTVNGRKIRPEDFGKELMQSAAEQVVEELHARLSSVRHPATGEFPVVVALGESLDDLYIRAEGSPELLELVRERFSDEELQHMRLTETSGNAPTKAFLSYTWEDRDLAEKLAASLQANGIDTWWAGWSLQAGDSLRQKIDQGLMDCTHFLVLLTPNSIHKPWVNQEMDAGLIRKLEAQARFIPLRANLAVTQLPPLLRGTLSPSIDEFDQGVQQLVNDIHNISRKPPLGSAPLAVNVMTSGYSPAASMVAKVFVEKSKAALFMDPQFSPEELADLTGLQEEDLTDSLHELRNLVEDHRFFITAKAELFVVFDAAFMQWDPAKDALRLAADLVNSPGFPSGPEEIAKLYEWTPRRLNPAISYLLNRKLIDARVFMGMGHWAAGHMQKNDATRRFVRSRS
jgi:hypothetical protein